jgi:hypothetical protein
MADLGSIINSVTNVSKSVGGVFSNVAERLNRSGLFPGAQPSQSLTARAQWSVRGNATDFRVKITLPPEGTLKATYFGGSSEILAPLEPEKGVIFPLTPSIVLTHSASYQELATTHSNYPFYAYSHTDVPTINITGDFPVQNYQDAQYWVGMVHFFRSVTKMFFGADNANRGNPPPILWLKGYGDYVFNNVPVVVKNFSVTMGQDVDYISTSQNNSVNAVNFEVTNKQESSSWAPAMSTVNLIVQPIYSRESTKNFSMTKFINGEISGNTNTRGFI